MDIKRLEHVIVESIHLLEDTRWTPSGNVLDWSKTQDGRNHHRIQTVLDTLRDTLIQLRSGSDRRLTATFHEGVEKEYNSDF